MSWLPTATAGYDPAVSPSTAFALLAPPLIVMEATPDAGAAAPVGSTVPVVLTTAEGGPAVLSTSSVPAGAPTPPPWATSSPGHAPWMAARAAASVAALVMPLNVSVPAVPLTVMYSFLPSSVPPT